MCEVADFERQMKLNKQEARELGNQELKQYGDRLPPNTLTNADGTPYVAESIEMPTTCKHQMFINAPFPESIPPQFRLTDEDKDSIRAIVREEVAKAKYFALKQLLLDAKCLSDFRYCGYTSAQIDEIIDYARQHGYGRGK